MRSTGIHLFQYYIINFLFVIMWKYRGNYSKPATCHKFTQNYALFFQNCDDVTVIYDALVTAFTANFWVFSWCWIVLFYHKDSIHLMRSSVECRLRDSLQILHKSWSLGSFDSFFFSPDESFPHPSILNSFSFDFILIIKLIHFFAILQYE